MPAKIIDGKRVAAKFLENIRKRASQSKEKPGLAIVLVGNNPASEIYVGAKEKTCKSVGVNCERYNLDENIKQIDLLKIIDELNQNKNIHGMIVQLPLPKRIDEKLIMDSILPHKDADGFTPVNLGNLVNDDNRLLPATARACMELIKSTGQKISGKNRDNPQQARNHTRFFSPALNRTSSKTKNSASGPIRACSDTNRVVFEGLIAPNLFFDF